MKKMLFKIGLILIIIALISIFIVMGFKKDKKSPQKQVFGVWWWKDELDSTYLDFAHHQGITEIYYCSSKFNNETQNFIKSATEKDIAVYWLAGEYQWIEDDTNLQLKIEKYLKYQQEYNYKFKGIHLDIEPHQHPDFKTKRTELITEFIELCYNLQQDYPNLYIEYDLPFWLDDVITFNNQTKPAHQFVIDYSSKVTIMSYRDTSETIYSVSKEEIEYALSVGKTLNLAVETKSTEGDNVSFMEEGKTIMLQEIEKLRKLIPSNFGIAIHQIYTWYHLAN